MDLARLLAREAVLLDAEPFADKREMFRQLSERLFQAGVVDDAGRFVEALEAREALGSTFMGNQIALPHGKGKTVIRSGIGFCRCKEPFRYRSGGEAGDVRFIFMLAVADDQSDNAHVRILARLAALLAHEEFIEALEGVQSAEEFIRTASRFQQRLLDD